MLGDVAWSLHRVGHVGFAGGMVDLLVHRAIVGEDGLSEDELLAGDQSVDAGRIQVELRPRLVVVRG